MVAQHKGNGVQREYLLHLTMRNCKVNARSGSYSVNHSAEGEGGLVSKTSQFFFMEVYQEILWKWFKERHPTYSVSISQGLDTVRAKGLTVVHYKTFYDNLEKLYTSNKYILDHIWNSNETGCAASRERI